jgi:hypothetical protein
MAERVTAGTTSHTIDLFLQDSSSATGNGLTGLTHSTTGLTAYYRKGGTGASTAITLATQTATGAWTSGGFAEIDATNMPGVYRLDLPNAVIDSAGYATVYLQGATNLLQTALRIDCKPVPAAVQTIATDAVDAGALASDAVAEIQSGLSTLDAAGVRTAVGLASANLDTQLADLPTVSEFEARTLVAAAYFDPATDAVANVTTVGSVSGSVTVGTNNDKTGYSLATAPPTAAAIADAVWDEGTAGHTTADTYGGRIVRSINSNVGVQITGSNHIAADVHEFQADVLTSNATAASFVTEVQSGLATSAALAVVDGIVDQLKSRSGYTMSILAGAISNAQNAAEAYTITLDGTAYGVTYSGLDSSGNRTGATLTET